MMSTQDKIIAYFLIFQAVVGAAAFAWISSRTELPLSSWIVLVPLVVGAFAAGFGSLRRYRWAIILALVVFAVQTPIIFTPYLNFHAWLVVHINVSATWGQATLGVNLLGLGMFVWAAIRSGAPNNAFKPSPHRSFS